MASNRKTGVLILTAPNFLKLLIAFLFVLFIYPCKAQIQGDMHIGYAFKTVQPYIAAGMLYNYKNVHVGGELIVNYRDDQPADIGFKASYQYSFIEAGVARYYQLYSLDAEKKQLNGWINGAFVTLHYKIWYVQYERLDGNRIAIGLRENL